MLNNLPARMDSSACTVHSSTTSRHAARAVGRSKIRSRSRAFPEYFPQLNIEPFDTETT